MGYIVCVSPLNIKLYVVQAKQGLWSSQITLVWGFISFSTINYWGRFDDICHYCALLESMLIYGSKRYYIDGAVHFSVQGTSSVHLGLCLRSKYIIV